MRQTLSANPPGLAIGRFIRALILGRGDPGTAADISRAWPDTPAVSLTFKSIVEAGDMTTSGWASQLASYGIATELLNFVNDRSIFGRLQPRMRPLEFRTPTAVVSDQPSASWVGEAGAKPVSTIQLASSAVTLEFYKLTVLTVYTQELARQSSPMADLALRDILVSAVVKTTDTQLLTPSVTAISGVRPGAITSGATEVTSTGSSAAQIEADLISMTAALTSSWTAPFWVMHPKTASNIQAKLGPAITNGQMLLLDIPVLKSTHSPAQIALVDAGAIVYARDEIRLSRSDQTTIEMETTPALGEQSPPSTQTVLKSMFQNNMIALLVEQGVSYLRGDDGAVVYMTVSY